MHRHVDLSLKAARVEKGFTQEALAEKLGVSKRTLVSWENGEVELKPLVLYAMAYVSIALGISPSNKDNVKSVWSMDGSDLNSSCV